MNITVLSVRVFLGIYLALFFNFFETLRRSNKTIPNFYENCTKSSLSKQTKTKTKKDILRYMILCSKLAKQGYREI